MPQSGPATSSCADEVRSGGTSIKLSANISLKNRYCSINLRVTAKSNRFTVHMRLQALKKAQGTDPKQFVVGEYCGSSTIERFLDPNRDTFNKTDRVVVLGPYKFRVLNSKRFGI